MHGAEGGPYKGRFGMWMRSILIGTAERSSDKHQRRYKEVDNIAYYSFKPLDLLL